MRTTAWIVQQDTEAYRYAEEIRAKLNADRKVTNIEMGQLAAAVYADALGIGEKRTAEEQEAPEDDLGDELQLGTNSATSKKVSAIIPEKRSREYTFQQLVETEYCIEAYTTDKRDCLTVVMEI